MIQVATINQYSKAVHRDIESLQQWHWNHDNAAISKEEQHYLTHNQDLINVLTKEKSPLRRLLDRSERLRKLRFWAHEKPRELPLYDADYVGLFSDKKIDRFMTVVILVIGLIMLIAPMWILQTLDNNNHKLGTITGFIVLFLGIVSYATAARPLEALAATAAYDLLSLSRMLLIANRYSAVLTVFLQLGGAE